MIAVENLMSTGVLSVRDRDTVRDALSTMHAAGIRHLPVEDEHHHVIGIVSDRDLKAVGPRSRGKRIGLVMSREVITIRAGEPAVKAARLMLENKMGSLPVVDEESNLIGIVTETDFLQVAMQALSGAIHKGGNHAFGVEVPS